MSLHDRRIEELQRFELIKDEETLIEMLAGKQLSPINHHTLQHYVSTPIRSAIP
jgi:hypothetical protein